MEDDKNLKTATVYVSFCKNDLATVLPLIHKLRSMGRSVQDSTDVTHTATNVQNSDVFVICISSSYAESDDCHSEFLLIHWQERPVIPVLIGDVIWPPASKLAIHKDYFLKLSALRLVFRSHDIDSDQVLRSVDSFSAFLNMDAAATVHGMFSVETLASWSNARREQTEELFKPTRGAGDDQIICDKFSHNKDYRKYIADDNTKFNIDRVDIKTDNLANRQVLINNEQVMDTEIVKSDQTLNSAKNNTRRENNASNRTVACSLL